MKDERQLQVESTKLLNDNIELVKRCPYDSGNMGIYQCLRENVSCEECLNEK